jgi:hypothetical protein
VDGVTGGFSLTKTVLSSAEHGVNKKRETSLEKTGKYFVSGGEEADGPVLFGVISVPFTFPNRDDGGVVPSLWGEAMGPGVVDVRK